MASSTPNKDITADLLWPNMLLKVFQHLNTSDLLSEWEGTVDCKTLWRGRTASAHSSDATIR